jgi:tetratricopeptide (TPR) repeat protein
MYDNEEPAGQKIKTNFFAHQAEEASSPITKQAPIMIVLVIIGLGVLYGLYSGVMMFINFEKSTAMKNVEVRFQKPTQKDGVAFVSVEVNNLNPTPIRDVAVTYHIKGPTGEEVSSGQLVIPGTVPSGDSRVFTEMKIGELSAQAGRLQAELSDLKVGPKANLNGELYAKFVEASSMKDIDALEAYKDFVKAAPEFAPGYVGLGQSLAANNDFENAIKSYQKALRIDPDDANAHYNLGVALFYKADREGAKKEFEAAKALEPDDPAVARGLQQLSGGTVPAAEQKSTAPQQPAAEQ